MKMSEKVKLVINSYLIDAIKETFKILLIIVISGSLLILTSIIFVSLLIHFWPLAIVFMILIIGVFIAWMHFVLTAPSYNTWLFRFEKVKDDETD